MIPGSQLRSPVFIAAGLVVIVAGLSGWALERGGARPDRREVIRARHLPDTVLTDQDGRSVHFYDDIVRGKVVAINFMYASCSKTCELSSQNIARLQDELKARQEITIYSISLDPEHDTPAVLQAYRTQHGARPGWQFLTAASVADVTDLRRKLGVFEPDSGIDSDLSRHTGMIVLGNEPKGRWTMVPARTNVIRIRQAIDRLILPPDQWPHGAAVIEEVPREDSAASLRP